MTGPHVRTRPPAPTLRDALRWWFLLGWLSFGGPAGQIALLQSELVDRRRWISPARFLHALGYCMALPGPEAQQLATYLGWLLHGTLGGVLAGTLFILPGFLVLVALSALYVAAGDLPLIRGVLHGVKPVVAALIAVALGRVGGRLAAKPAGLLLAGAGFAALQLGVGFPWVVLAAVLLAVLVDRVRPGWLPNAAHHATRAAAGPAVIDDDDPPPEHAQVRAGRLIAQATTLLLLGFGPWGALRWWQGPAGTHVQMAEFFTGAALVTFGGAYAVLPYVARHAETTYRWLAPTQMLDGLALGESTPGPLILVVSFVGFLGGWNRAPGDWGAALLGAVVATYFTFLPSFAFILLGGPWIERLRHAPRWHVATVGVNAAAAAAIAQLALFAARNTWFPGGAIDPPAVLLALAGVAALVSGRASAPVLVLAGALLGVAGRATGLWLSG